MHEDFLNLLKRTHLSAPNEDNWMLHSPLLLDDIKQEIWCGSELWKVLYPVTHHIPDEVA